MRKTKKQTNKPHQHDKQQQQQKWKQTETTRFQGVHIFTWHRVSTRGLHTSRGVARDWRVLKHFHTSKYCYFVVSTGAIYTGWRVEPVRVARAGETKR